MRQLPTTDLAGVLAMDPCWLKYAEDKARGRELVELVEQVFLSGGKPTVTALDIVDFALANSRLLDGEDAQWVACHILPVDLPVHAVVSRKFSEPSAQGRGEYVWTALPYGRHGLDTLRGMLVDYMEGR